MNQTGKIANETSRLRRFPWSLIFAALFFCTLFRLDFPKPTLDDLFFIGASLNLADGGDFSNPLIERQNYPSHFYFGHPPTYSYALAGWLKMFGVSTGSLLGFQLALYLLICGALVWLLRHYRARPWLEWLVPLGVGAALLPEGLRPESLAVALSLSGFALVEWGRLRAISWFFGLLLMIFGASVDSRLVFFSAAMLLAALAGLRQKGVPTVRLLALTGGAGLLAGLILLQFIGFRVAEFWQTYHFLSAGKLNHNKLAAFTDFFRNLSIIQWPLILLWTAALPGLLRTRDRTPPVRLGKALVGAFVVTALVGALGHGTYWYVFLVLIMALAAGLKHGSQRWALMRPLFLAAALLIADSRLLIYAYGLAAHKIKADPGDPMPAAKSLRSTPEHPVLIDSEAARYVFDYRLPPSFLDWNFSANFPGSLPTDDPLCPGDVYLIGPGSVDWLNRKTHLNLELPRWKPLGPRKSFHEFPRQAYVIHPSECGAMWSP